MGFRIAAIAVILIACALAGLAVAQSRDNRDPNALPKYFSLRSDDVNLRAGPGVRYPIEWVYKRRNLPVEVVAEFETWRRIRDVDGVEGWVHQSTISARRTILITGDTRILKARPDAEAPPVAMLEAGVVGTLAQCRNQWCNVEAGGYRGWLQRSDFWGVYPDESVR